MPIHPSVYYNYLLSVWVGCAGCFKLIKFLRRQSTGSWHFSCPCYSIFCCLVLSNLFLPGEQNMGPMQISHKSVTCNHFSKSCEYGRWMDVFVGWIWMCVCLMCDVWNMRVEIISGCYARRINILAVYILSACVAFLEFLLTPSLVKRFAVASQSRAQ